MTTEVTQIKATIVISKDTYSTGRISYAKTTIAENMKVLDHAYITEEEYKKLKGS
jgi:hypothetical protein